jgi:hypothetical protein
MISNILILKKYVVFVISVSYVLLVNSSFLLDYIFVTIIFGIIYTLLYFRIVDNNYKYVGSYSEKYSMSNYSLIIVSVLLYNMTLKEVSEYLNMIPMLILLSLLTLVSMLILKYRKINNYIILLFPILFLLSDSSLMLFGIDIISSCVFFNNIVFIGIILTLILLSLISVFNLL